MFVFEYVCVIYIYVCLLILLFFCVGVRLFRCSVCVIFVLWNECQRMCLFFVVLLFAFVCLLFAVFLCVVLFAS